MVTAGQDAAFGQVVAAADMATPDGAPVAWMMRKLGFTEQQRINGPALMWRYCAQAALRDESIYLYGGAPETLVISQAKLAQINASGAGKVWMAAHRGRINAVMIGVGAAFDFHAGTVSRAPAWMLSREDHGLPRRYAPRNDGWFCSGGVTW